MDRQGTITSVERQKKQTQRYNIFIDEQFAFAVHEDVLVKHHLFKGQTVLAQQLEEVLADEERQDAYLRAIRWLGSRPRTQKELRQYLTRRGYEKPTIDDCLKRLEAQSYVDDERFSEMLAEERLSRHGKGKQWIRQELLHKGVDKSMVEKAVAAIEPDKELEAACLIAAKRWRTLSGQEDRLGAKRKLYGYLARRGFTASIVQAAVRHAVSGEDVSDSEDEWSFE